VLTVPMEAGAVVGSRRSRRHRGRSRVLRVVGRRAGDNAGTVDGTLAANIGLAGKATLEEFLRVLDGRDPRTGKPWVPRRKDHAAGVEIAASAPKSVSVVGVLSSAETSAVVQEALDFGAEVVLDYIVEHVKLVRRGRNGTIVETARELLAVAFDHETSRQTKQQPALGIPADPGKHKHIVIPVARRHDGRLAAIDYAR
jgi:conjugative relaxase-like TrwC/TraI family protein